MFQKGTNLWFFISDFKYSGGIHKTKSSKNQDVLSSEKIVLDRLSKISKNEENLFSPTDTKWAEVRLKKNCFLEPP